MQRAGLAFLLGSTLLATATPTLALPSDSSQTITLEADRATYNEKTGITTYTGNVVIQQGTIKIQADSLVANLNKNRQIQQITAKGRPAKFQQQISAEKGIARGEGQTIVYNSETGIITMTGKAYLFQDGASFRGNTLRYSISAGDIEASGGSQGRIQIIIPPSATQNQTKVKSK
ncbi:lipopolysaccharide transport periplasmic protein LptA [Alkanindiges hydrocarboniclasticus]|uniref:Lipopolysaccharide export system protein LptA n=1 Tax=Alkanindiges hydrocarboniclasticus TaxID=1907941 RepID=A0A1S8CVV7_9GAMM|nr:lipopolysaccharide transport periplasmic protein LptA [Alkanindiges hydrocarboniclasticus]